MFLTYRTLVRFAIACLLLPMGVISARADWCDDNPTTCDNCDPPKITLLPIDPPVIDFNNVNTLEFSWKADSPCGNCFQWGYYARFILDDGAGGYAADIIDDAGGGGGDWHSSRMQISNLFDFRCRHTLKICGLIPENGDSCGNQSYAEVCSNEIEVWIVDDMEHCDDSPPMCSELFGRPVDAVSGDMFYEHTDLLIDGPLPIEFRRRYSSRNPVDGIMGYGWQHNFMIRLSSVSSELTQTFINHEMKSVSFRCADWNSGTETCDQWGSNQIYHLSLEEGSDPPWTITDRESTKFEFDEDGRLIAVRDRNGNTITLTYSGSPERLSTISDQFGRQISLAYTSGRLLSISADDRTVTYSYSDDNLTSVELPDETTLTQEYYSSSGVNAHRLRKVTDANNHIVEEHTYSSANKVLTTQAQDGNNRFEFVYGGSGSTTRTVTNSLGEDTTLTINVFKGVASSITGPGCSSCGSGVSIDRDYDKQLNPTRIEDATGAITEFQDYDTRGNVGSVVEAVGEAEERTTTFTYHEVWNRPTEIRVPTLGIGNCAEEHPDKITTFDYDEDSGDLLQEETVGCNGDEEIVQTTVYTYDAHGQITSIDGPRTAVSDVTTYTYYDAPEDTDNDIGRLKTVTDAAGNTTT
jgi:YD repeat-containing protein